MHPTDLEKVLREREAAMNREYAAALDLANFDRTQTILDVATGSGRLLLQMVQRGYSVIAGDIDEEALLRSRERLGDLSSIPSYVTMDAHHMQFDDASFRAITCANAIHEMEGPRGALDEMGRVLSNDGKLLVIEFTRAGYDLIALHHQMQGRPEHPTGEMRSEDIDSYLKAAFPRVESEVFEITVAWVAYGKR